MNPFQSLLTKWISSAVCLLLNHLAFPECCFCANQHHSHLQRSPVWSNINAVASSVVLLSTCTKLFLECVAGLKCETWHLLTNEMKLITLSDLRLYTQADCQNTGCPSTFANLSIQIFTYSSCQFFIFFTVQINTISLYCADKLIQNSRQ